MAVTAKARSSTALPPRLLRTDMQYLRKVLQKYAVAHNMLKVLQKNSGGGGGVTRRRFRMPGGRWRGRRMGGGREAVLASLGCRVDRQTLLQCPQTSWLFW